MVDEIPFKTYPFKIIGKDNVEVWEKFKELNSDNLDVEIMRLIRERVDKSG